MFALSNLGQVKPAISAMVYKSRILIRRVHSNPERRAASWHSSSWEAFDVSWYHCLGGQRTTQICCCWQDFWRVSVPSRGLWWISMPQAFWDSNCIQLIQLPFLLWGNHSSGIRLGKQNANPPFGSIASKFHANLAWTCHSIHLGVKSEFQPKLWARPAQSNQSGRVHSPSTITASKRRLLAHTTTQPPTPYIKMVHNALSIAYKPRVTICLSFWATLASAAPL